MKKSKIHKCKNCGEKLGAIIVPGGFCCFKCRNEWKESKKNIENMC